LPPPQGSWLFELLPPPGSFHAIAFSVVKNRETAPVGPPADTIIRASYSKCRPLREPQPASTIATDGARGRRRAASPRACPRGARRPGAGAGPAVGGHPRSDVQL